MGSGKGCGIQFLKFLLIFFNILFMLLGIGIIAAGAYVLSQLGGTSLTEIVGVGAVFVVVGVLILLLAFLGCCGAMKQNKCMLYTFAVCIIVIIIIEIAVAIAAFVYQDTVEEVLDEVLNEEYEKLVNSMDDTILGVVTLIQDAFDCCGYNTTTQNFVTSMNATTDAQLALKQSCYPDKNTAATAYEPCKDKVIAAISEYYLIIGGVGIAFALIEVLGVIFACCVARHDDLDKMA